MASICDHVQQIIVVDDGSTDQTATLAEQAGATVIRLGSNNGKGVALRAGLQQAIDSGFDFAITMDGDGQHLVADLPNFLNAAFTDRFDLVIGNRMSDTSEMPWIRREVNRWMSRKISKLAGCELPDTQCGYRLIRLSLWNQREWATTGFEIESEMLFSFVRMGGQLSFVPIATVYKEERSKIHPVRDTIRWLRWWRHNSQQHNKKNVLAADAHSKTSSQGHVRSTS